MASRTASWISFGGHEIHGYLNRRQSLAISHSGSLFHLNGFQKLLHFKSFPEAVPKRFALLCPSSPFGDRRMGARIHGNTQTWISRSVTPVPHRIIDSSRANWSTGHGSHQSVRPVITNPSIMDLIKWDLEDHDAADSRAVQQDNFSI